MLPEARPRQALLLGLGGGTVASLLVRRLGPVPILAVEKTTAVVDLAYQAFSLPRDIEVVLADAFDYVLELERSFDYLAVDLFENGAVPARVFGTPFLRRLKRLTNPGGLIAINFFKDGRSDAHRHRLERVFPRVQVVPCEKNLVALCRVR
ncbi:MAG: hypothetical protein HY534_00545 [Chloroflexi bacterium]|nr:hypothetical protein [Chloroflexota bacterium]